MSVKVLLDPVYSTVPSRCSTSFKCKALVEEMLERRGKKDVFFYWMIPKGLSEEERAWLPKHEKIVYIEFPYYKDRLREYIRYPYELDMIQAFNGDWWDFDVLVTSRSSMIPLSGTVMHSPREKRHANTTKKIFLIEEMFMMQFRPTVAMSNIPMQEIMTLAGYLEASKVTIQTGLERRCVIETARRYFAPSVVREIASHLVQCVPIYSDLSIELKKPEFRYKKGERPFCLSFTGRLENISSSLEKVYRTMTTQYIMKGLTDLKLLVCTVDRKSVV